MSSMHKLAEQIKHTVEELPYEKQQQIYDFAEYLKKKNNNARSDGSSLLKMVGTIKGPVDMAANHDAVYDD